MARRFGRSRYKKPPTWAQQVAYEKKLAALENSEMAKRMRAEIDRLTELNRRPLEKKNPRRVRSNSTTLRNLASVKITRNRDGTVGIVARRNAPKKRNR